MKKIIRVFALIAAAVSAASCTLEIHTDTVSGLTQRYNLTFAGSTKTELSGSGDTRQVHWAEGDAIKYYTVTEQDAAASADVTVDGNSAYVQIPRGRTDEFINAVYGASQLKSVNSTADCMYVSSPVKNNQQYTSFAEAHLCAAFSDDIYDTNLSFHNAAAIVKLTSSAAIHKLVFYGNNEEVITAGNSGDVKISYADGVVTTVAASSGGTTVTVETEGAETDFYIAILPVGFSAGFTVDCYDENQELIARQKIGTAINTVSNSGAPKIINLGRALDWLANPQPVAIDLGLSVKWARCNLGATEPEQYGDYYAWGETEPKETYGWSTYKWCNGSFDTPTKYINSPKHGQIDNKTVLDLEDDAAFVNWGGSWRMPTTSEQAELVSNCTWAWTTLNGVDGKLVTGPNGNSIFLPASAIRDGTSFSSSVGNSGDYLSSSSNSDAPFSTWIISFYSDYVYSGCTDRCYGLTIRPVTE